MFNQLRLLEEAEAMITDFDNWGVGSYFSRREDSDNPEPRCCALGAVLLAAEKGYSVIVRDAAVETLQNTCFRDYGVNVADLNDQGGCRDPEIHQEVLKLFNAAIADLEAKMAEEEEVQDETEE